MSDLIKVGPANGVTPGDDRAYPNRGTRSGLVGKGEPYGADIGVNATNRLGGFSADSDPMAKEFADDERQTMPGGHQHNGGRRMSGAESDGMMDTTPGDEGMPGDRD
jgi:hypothetical protein